LAERWVDLVFLSKARGQVHLEEVIDKLELGLIQGTLIGRARGKRVRFLQSAGFRMPTRKRSLSQDPHSKVLGDGLAQ
jgi:hypothetical protein